MERREALKNTLLGLGVAVSSPLLAKLSTALEATDDAYKPVFLSKDQLSFIAEFADVVFPETDTPSAKAVGVHRMIDVYLKEVEDPKWANEFLKDLNSMMKRCINSMNKSFVALNNEKRVAFLNEEVKQFKAGKNDFFNSLKFRVIGMYINTQEGASEYLAYDPIPGGYTGCIDLQPGQRNWR